MRLFWFGGRLNPRAQGAPARAWRPSAEAPEFAGAWKRRPLTLGYMWLRMHWGYVCCQARPAVKAQSADIALCPWSLVELVHT